MVKLIIFDLGGVVTSPDIEYLDHTIADFLSLNITELREVTSRHKSAVTKGEICLEDVYSYVADEFSLPIKPAAILEKHLEIFREILSELNQKTISIVGRLRKEHHVVALANAEQEVIPIAREFGIYDLFEKSYISCEMGMQKPDERIYKFVLNDYRSAPKDAIFIDDKLENVKGARRIGINALHHTPQINLEEELKRLGA